MSTDHPDQTPPVERHVDPVIEVYKKDVDRTLIRALLKATPEERINNLQNALADLMELRRAMKAATKS